MLTFSRGAVKSKSCYAYIFPGTCYSETVAGAGYLYGYDHWCSSFSLQKQAFHKRRRRWRKIQQTTATSMGDSPSSLSEVLHERRWVAWYTIWSGHYCKCGYIIGLFLVYHHYNWPLIFKDYTDICFTPGLWQNFLHCPQLWVSRWLSVRPPVQEYRMPV